MIFYSQITKFLEAMGFSKSKILYTYAKSQVGNKKSGVKAPIAFGCAEAVNKIFLECFGTEIGGDVSTLRMYQALSRSIKFSKVTTAPEAGDIVISPTGYGNGSLANGHVGICSEQFKILSNNSDTGKWEENYTIPTWYKRYAIQGGFPVYFFRVIIG